VVVAPAQPAPSILPQPTPPVALVTQQAQATLPAPSPVAVSPMLPQPKPKPKPTVKVTDRSGQFKTDANIETPVTESDRQNQKEWAKIYQNVPDLESKKLMIEDLLINNPNNLKLTKTFQKKLKKQYADIVNHLNNPPP
jgi:hypothetical protein